MNTGHVYDMLHVNNSVCMGVCIHHIVMCCRMVCKGSVLVVASYCFGVMTDFQVSLICRPQSKLINENV